MEPVQRNDTSSELSGYTNKRQSVVLPRISLPNRYEDASAGKEVTTDEPIVGLPLRAAQEKRGMQVDPAVPKQLSPSRFSLPAHAHNQLPPPSQPPATSLKRESPSQKRGAAVLPETGKFKVQTSFRPEPGAVPRKAGKHRWEHQASRYPPELLELIEADTQKLQAVVPDETPTPRATPR